MMEREVTIINKLGLHARAAAKFVTLASHFASSVDVVRGNQTVNGKSIMGVMMLAASKDTVIKIVTNGADEETALNELEALINNRFDEAE